MEKRANCGMQDGAVLLEGVGVPGEEFSGGDLCSRDFLPGREVSSVGIIVRDGEGGNRVYCTSATMYVNSEGMRFPNLLLDGEMDGVPIEIMSQPSAAIHSSACNSARHPGSAPSIRFRHPLISNFFKLVHLSTSLGISVSQSL